MKEHILIIGACGQIGSELTMAMREKYGNDHVTASDIREGDSDMIDSGPFVMLDILDKQKLEDIIKTNKVTQIYNLAAVLSATGEKNPGFAWKLNMEGLLNTLQLAKNISHINKVFWPSSIAVFGPGTPKKSTPQNTVMDPDTVYGISKLAGERWCEYYWKKYGVDVRSVRYPGLISYKAQPGGGTTDYAVEIFYEAVKNNKYECFLSKNTELPMMYMPDAIRGTIELMEAPAEKINIRSSYNFAGFSFSPAVLSQKINELIPGFEINYAPDYRQDIASSWPKSIDDTNARNDWNWLPEYSLEDMTKEMLEQIRKKSSSSVPPM